MADSRHAQNAGMISLNALRIPDSYQTEPTKVDDDILRNSIQLTGVQQPLIVSRISDTEYIVIDGMRRYRAARALNLRELPCVIDRPPAEGDSIEYRNRIRFILDEHRQDLLPTQRATLIRQLQKTFGMSTVQVATYLGVTAGTVRNWLLVEELIPELQRSIDSERIRLHSARAFAGVTESGQRKIWEQHRKELEDLPGGRFHQLVRQQYPPSAFPEMYRSPQTAERRQNPPKKRRRGRKRAKVSVEEKDTLLRDVDAKRIELDDKRSQIAELQKDIEAAIPVIDAIREAKQVWDMLPKGVRTDFEEFASRFLPG